MEDRIADLRLSDFEKEGLYLLFPDSTKLELTKENIEKVTDRYWQDLTKIPEDKRKAIKFQKCYFCPHKNNEDICDSIRPMLPFLDIVDRYVSYDKVMAVYKGTEEKLVHIRATTMQDALKYVSILSLLRYNLVLQKYWKYYLKKARKLILQVEKPLKYWGLCIPISKEISKVVKIYNGSIFLIFWMIWSRVCLEIYSAGNLSIFWWSVLTNLAGNTKNSVRIVSKVAS